MTFLSISQFYMHAMGYTGEAEMCLRKTVVLLVGEQSSSCCLSTKTFPLESSDSMSISLSGLV